MKTAGPGHLLSSDRAVTCASLGRLGSVSPDLQTSFLSNSDKASLCPPVPKVGVVWAWLAENVGVVGGWSQCPRTNFQKVGAYVRSTMHVYVILLCAWTCIREADRQPCIHLACWIEERGAIRR